MKTITIRGLDSLLVNKIKEAARAEKNSMNGIILEIIKQYFGLKKERKFRPVHHDMDHLFGKWTQSEFVAITKKIKEQKTIDKEIWR